MLERIVSMIGIWTIVLATLFFFGAQGAVWIMVLLCGAAQWELYTLFNRMGFTPYTRAGIAIGSFLILGSFYFPGTATHFDPDAGMDILAIGVGIACVLSLGQEFRKYMRTLLPTIFGILYLPFMLNFLVQIFKRWELVDRPDIGIFMGLWVVSVAKFSDVGGYAVGKFFGRKKLAPSISPGKTWEGTAGAIATSILIGMLLALIFNRYLPEGLNVLYAGCLALPIGTLAIISDLVESSIKRQADVKDSGSIIPGIGGALDLVDSLILTVPFAYLLFKYTLF